MYRLLFSLLFEIKNSAIKPNAKLFQIAEEDFRELIILVSHLGYVRGEILTFTECSLAGAALTALGENFLMEHSYFLSEYPEKSALHKWILEESAYTRRL